ncbi:MAG: class I SAM-dependent methyltransferase [Candidatus Aenigmarchaeota archaeon]|nr:class I SAM-dependent methyltransferase [Candidatus Aenigmarchaeota archaeon]MBU5689122.1 class I SAM-dependent methyltransferase [Candidatus Aenigmarchaeota archaeon]
MKILDIGCSTIDRKYKSSNPKDKVIGLDKFHVNGADVLADLEKTLPFKDNSFDMIIASHVLEHTNNFFSVMEEIHRILKPKGILKVWVPHFSSNLAYTNPDHKRFFAAYTFDHFKPENIENYYSKARFNIRKRKLIIVHSGIFYFLNYIFNPIINLRIPFFEKFINPFIRVDDIYVEMECIK